MNESTLAHDGAIEYEASPQPDGDPRELSATDEDRELRSVEALDALKAVFDRRVKELGVA